MRRSGPTPTGYDAPSTTTTRSRPSTKFSHRFPGLTAASLSSSYAGLLRRHARLQPVIGPAPLDGLFLCAGFSGHGYKISPAVGDLMADLICDRHQP